jgi:hypothetical protein
MDANPISSHWCTCMVNITLSLQIMILIILHANLHNLTLFLVGKFRSIRNDNIKLDLKEIRLEDM